MQNFVHFLFNSMPSRYLKAMINAYLPYERHTPSPPHILLKTLKKHQKSSGRLSNLARG